MQIIRQYVVPENGKVTIDVPQAFNGQQVEVQLVLAEDAKPARSKKRTTGLEQLVGSINHLTLSQKEVIQSRMEKDRDEWERPVY